ncbi:NUDIX domain-containing protein [Nocardioides sp. WS12]|uniref:NUDIX hydrolase n=1 Tax=Nocardioides sp. WS12 TaxID=2486272 RepID=UPI0015FA2C8C|nr:NUDIX domain-containing protein [Nocardioides sp. WS12]
MNAKNYVGQPAPTRDAATVAILRDGDGGLESFFLRRQSTMEFAPDMYVFPGGGVQASDEAPVRWAGPTPDEWAGILSCEPRMAVALVVAAVRETFEETGILLAGPDESTVVGDVSAPVFLRARDALEAKKIGFADLLDEQGLVLRSDLLGAWAHWITPEFEPRRYDTRFFVARMPDGQSVGALATEAAAGEWHSLTDTLRMVKDGDLAMLPPTIHTCLDLVGHRAADVVAEAASRTIEPIQPRLVVHEGGYFLDDTPDVVIP